MTSTAFVFAFIDVNGLCLTKEEKKTQTDLKQVNGGKMMSEFSFGRTIALTTL